MKGTFRNIISKLFPSLYWKEILFLHRLKGKYDGKKNQVFIENWGIALDLQKYNFILSKLNKVCSFYEDLGAKFSLQPEGDLIIEVDGIKNIVQTAEDFYILCEIYLQGVYNFSSPKGVVYVDIGMNVGFSSLYFARKENCRAVYSYEPFLQTYNQAIRNFSINQTILKKIHAYNFGIDDHSYETKVNYAYEYKGSIGLQGIPSHLRYTGSIEVDNISLQKPNIIFDLINDTYPGSFIFLKLDCEGSEYNILDEIIKCGYTNQIVGMAIEWHINGSSSICEKLRNKGYSIISLRPFNKLSGMIYAVRTNDWEN